MEENNNENLEKSKEEEQQYADDFQNEEQQQSDQIINQDNKKQNQEVSVVAIDKQDEEEVKQQKQQNEELQSQLKFKQLPKDQEDPLQNYKPPRMNVREATHSGSYYSKHPNELNIQLNAWIDMAKIELQNIKQVKAIIAPHSAFYYSGPIAAWAYKYIKIHNQEKKKLRVFLFGPCHYVFIRNCGITSLSKYETPLGTIEIDRETIEELKQNSEKLVFEDTDKDAEEEEYSIEMQLPFLVKTLGVENFKLIPIMVGSIDNELEEEYGRLFAKYFMQPDTLFVVSTDFCHWGPKGLQKYFQETQNNVCGRHALGILIQCLYQLGLEDDLETKFIKYGQSNFVKDKSDNSVSFAASVSYIEKDEQN